MNAENRATKFSTTIAFWKALDIRMRWLSTVLFLMTIDQNLGHFLLCSGDVAPRYLSNYSFRPFICCLTILCLMFRTCFLMSGYCNNHLNISGNILLRLFLTMQRLQYSRIKKPILYVIENIIIFLFLFLSIPFIQSNQSNTTNNKYTK